MNHPLRELLTLEDRGHDANGHTLFAGPIAPERRGRMFGGQLLAQAIVGAGDTTTGDRVPHSVHAHFLRPGSVDEPTEIAVASVRDGRSFSTRHVSIAQGGRELFMATVSFHVPEDGLDHSPAIPDAVPEPDQVTTTYSDFVTRSMPADDWDGGERPIEMRYVNPPPPGTSTDESQKMWCRITPDTTLGDEPWLHLAGLAYLSDATLIDHALIPHGHRWHDPRLTGASLDHTMYFHIPTRCDDWLMFDQSVLRTSGARGTCLGTQYDQSGSVVATCIQEGLIRWAETT